MKTNSQRNLLAIARGDRGLLVVDGEATAVESVRSSLNESVGKKESQCKIWQAGNERRILKWNHLCEHV
jgi:hypothetical protein